MNSTFLIPVLCVVIGLLAGALILNFIKSKGKNEMGKTRDKSVKMVEKLPMEFSKKILVVTATVTLFIVFAAVGMSYLTQTTDVFAYLIPSIFGSLSIGLGFYYNKAKAENIIMLKNEHGDDAAELARKTMKNEDY